MDKDVYIHSSAVIDDNVHIGPSSKIWHFCHLMSGTRLGEQCILGQNVFVGKDVQIGNRVKIQNNVSLYTGVAIEDEVFIGPSVVFTNVINPRATVERKEEFKNTLVKQGASIGANSTIICGNAIGEYAMIGAGSVVTRNIKNHELVVGNPARHLAWVSKSGNKLHFENGKATCPHSGESYSLIDNEVMLAQE